MPVKVTKLPDYHALYVEERKRYDELLERYHALRMTGASPKPENGHVTPVAVDLVQQAIRARASKLPMGARAQAMQAMGLWAQGERGKQTSDIDIILGLERGVNVNEDDPPTQTE